MEQVLFPALSSVQSEEQRLQAGFTRASVGLCLLTLPLSGTLLVLAPELVDLLLGDGWEPLIVPFQILVCVLFFRTGYKVSEAVARALGAVYHSAWRQWLYACLIVAGAYLGQHLGLSGVATGVAVAIALNYIVSLMLATGLTGISLWPFLKIHFRYAVLAGAVTALVWGVSDGVRSTQAGSLAVLAAGGATALLCSGIVFRFRDKLLEREGLKVVGEIVGRLRY
jgi:PST family polysaccharide transporter